MALEAGGNACLDKPVDAKALLQMLSEQLNLAWTYDTNQDDSETSNASSTAVILPPTEVLQALFDLAQACDIKVLHEQIVKLMDTDMQYQSFAKPILHLAQQFKVEEIEELLEHYLTEELARGE